MLGLTSGNFNEKALNFVVLNTKRGNACGLTLPNFHLGQKFAHVVAQLAKRGQFFVIGTGNHITITQKYSWISQECRVKFFVQRGINNQFACLFFNKRIVNGD